MSRDDTPSWGARQWLATAAVCIILLLNGYWGFLSWSYRHMDDDVRALTRELPRVREQIETLQRRRDSLDAVVTALQENQSARAVQIAVAEDRYQQVGKRLDKIDQRLENVLGFLGTRAP